MIQENFIEENIGNYKDCIENIIYQLQKYSNILMLNLDESIASTEPFLLSEKFVGFLRCENEEILNQKMLKTAVDICNTISRKHNLFKRLVSSNFNENLSYIISKDAYEFLEEDIESIDWLQLSVHYHYTTKDKAKIGKELYVFDDYLKEVGKEYKEKFTKMNRITVSSKEALCFSNKCRFTSYTTIRRLKTMMETSPSCYYSAIIIRQMIRVLVLLYFTMTTIEIVDK